MKYDFSDFCIMANLPDEIKAAEILTDEIKTRTGKTPEIVDAADDNCVKFTVCSVERLPHKDCYEIQLFENNCLEIFAYNIRGFLMGIGNFLRKTVYDGEEITLIKDVSGKYIPDKAIRGHQIGYRPTTNTFDAWSPEDMRRHYLDSMYYGCNITELIPTDHDDPKDLNRLMKYTKTEHMIKSSKYAQELDMDISLWYPNDKSPVEESAEIRKKTVESMERINVIFPPGGDPGEYPADEFIERICAISKAVKSVSPDIKMFPSAQAPHKFKNWGDGFVKGINEAPDGLIDGFIQGPNRAFEIDEIRKKVSLKYPLRLYPDITHNVRCEYPVHYTHEDWHYSLASTNGRESINPRPVEYKRIHSHTSPYTVGSVSYSEGVNDDVNKMVWSMLEFDKTLSIMEILEDYARLFVWGASAELFADGVMGLEYNWYGDPCENPSIENTLRIFRELIRNTPSLSENWRFMMCLFRAEFDMCVKMRRKFELDLIDEMKICVCKGQIGEAMDIISCDYDDDYYNLRAEIEEMSDTLFELIGMQTSVERHCAAHWERGAVMETIDRPVTNRTWFKKKLENAIKMPKDEALSFMREIIDRDIVDTDEVYFSFTLHGYEGLNSYITDGEPYISFMGDTPKNENGDIPMELLKVYDHYSFRGKFGGLTAPCNYNLKVTFHDRNNDGTGEFYIKINDQVLYEGVRYGGEKDTTFDEKMLCKEFFTVNYTIPHDMIQNGCLELLIGEKTGGCEICELWITKKS